MRIIAIHLLNDYSGSPKVLKQLLNIWQKNKINVHLFTAFGREGFLSGQKKITYHYFWYQFYSNVILRFFSLFFSQFLLFFKLLLFLEKSDVVYVNTVLPFAAGFAGKLKGCKVIYHIHETSMKPQILKKFLFGIVQLTATEVVYVSHFLAKQEPLAVKHHILHNVLENDFVQLAENRKSREEKKQKNVLMICSLKAYKGVDVFVYLAQQLHKFHFQLVVNASQAEIDRYFMHKNLPKNLKIYATQKVLHPLYNNASLVLNLSDTKLWVETFGLTILEAMAYALPTIVPPIGGVTELVDDGMNGYLIDSKNTDEIIEKINKILSNNVLYFDLSRAAYQKSLTFSEENFEKESMKILINRS